MKIKESTLKKLLTRIAQTRPDEIGCEVCFAELDRFADMLRDGKEPAEVMPLVKEHLQVCGNCKEELEALIQAIESHEEKA